MMGRFKFHPLHSCSLSLRIILVFTDVFVPHLWLRFDEFCHEILALLRI